MVIDCSKEDNPLIQKKLKEVTVEEGLEILEFFSWKIWSRVCVVVW